MSTKYRIKHIITRETLTDKEVEEYYSIEYRTRKYFGLFGPYIWKDYYDYVNTVDDDLWMNLKFKTLEDVNVVVARLNKGLEKTYCNIKIIESEG